MNPVHLALGAAIVALAIIGLCWVLARVADGLERAWDWLSWRFRGDDEDDYTDDTPDYCPCGKPMDHTEFCYDELDDGDHAWCGRDDLDPLPLPPEGTWEQMTSHQLPAGALMEPCGREFWDGLYGARRERLPEWYEAEYRHHYAAMDLEYPSGLLARVREAGQ